MQKVLWRDSLGEPVDLDDIDREYALNIYTMVVQRRAILGYTPADLRTDELVQKLREVILTGREPTKADKMRAMIYNVRNKQAGLPWRATR